MALIEAEESEVNEARALATTLRSLMGNPGARRKVLEAQKILKPDAVIPELDAAEPVIKAVSAMEDRLSKWMKERDEKDAKREEDARVENLKARWNESRNKAKAEGYTEEGLKALEEFMEQRGIADHDLAIPAFERLHPPAKSEAPSNKGFSIFNPDASKDDAGMKMLMEQQFDKFLDVSIPQVLADVRSQRGR